MFFTKTGRRSPQKRPANQRRIVLVDVENVVGGSAEVHDHVTWAKATVERLVSVRSGARASMPGMMDTILNLGLNDATVEGLAAKTGNSRFAYDSYRRFIQMYSDVVLGVHHDEFEDLLDLMKNERDFSQDTDLTADDLKEPVAQYKERVAQAEKTLPAGCQRAALGRGARCVR